MYYVWHDPFTGTLSTATSCLIRVTSCQLVVSSPSSLISKEYSSCTLFEGFTYSDLCVWESLTCILIKDATDRRFV